MRIQNPEFRSQNKIKKIKKIKKYGILGFFWILNSDFWILV